MCRPLDHRLGFGAAVLVMAVAASCSKNSRIISMSKSDVATDKNISVAGESTTVGQYNSQYRGTQIMEGASESGTLGTSVSFPAGALAINAQVGMGAGESLANNGVANGLGVNGTLSSASSPIVITSNPAQNAVNPFVLSIPVSGSTGLTEDLSNLIIIYEAYDAPRQAYTIGLMTSSMFEVVGGKAKIKVSMFGTYQAAVSSTKISVPVTKDGKAKDVAAAFDRVAPTAALSSSVGAATGESPIPVTITFSEEVSGFTSSDLAVSNGVAGTAVGSGTTYTVDVTPTASGTLRIDLAANQAKDGAGNGNVAAEQLAIVFTPANPNITLSTGATLVNSVAAFSVTATFDKAVTGFDLTDVILSGGTKGNLVAVNASVYTFDVTPDGSSTIAITVGAGAAADSWATASNLSNALNVTYDATQPAVTLARA